MMTTAEDLGTTSKQMISQAERWLLVSEKAYMRAQRSGFVGGDPMVFWSEAEKEVDAKYDTTSVGAFSNVDAEKLTEQVKTVFGGLGFGYLDLDDLLAKHRSELEELAERNRLLLESTSELASQQSAVLQDAVNEAVNTMQSFAQGKVSTDGVVKQAELSMKALENVMSHFQTLTQVVTGVKPPKKKDDGK